MITGQLQLLSTDPAIETHARSAAKRILGKRSEDQAVDLLSVCNNDHPNFKMVDVSSLEADEVRSVGPEYVCHCIWKELKIDDILLLNDVPQSSIPLIETLVVGRLVAPGSERDTWAWAENRSAIFELAGKPGRFSLSSFYRAADRAFDVKDEIESHLSRQEKEMFSLPENLCFFDLTNTYMEGQSSGNPKAKRGHSKEKRSDCKLLTLALRN